MPVAATACSASGEPEAIEHVLVRGRLPLLAVGAAAARREIEMEVVAVRFVGLWTKHRRERSAGTLVQPAQKPAFNAFGRIVTR